MAKTISVERVKGVLARRYDELADAFAYLNATGETDVAARFSGEKDVVLDIARDLFGAGSYTIEMAQKSIAGAGCACQRLVWTDGGA